MLNLKKDALGKVQNLRYNLDMDKKVISTNRKAFHDYLIFDKYIAGIVLKGTEIKSIRKGAVNLKDSFAKVEKGEVFLYNCNISKYEQGNRYNHEPERVRKLKKGGYTIVPLEIFLSRGYAKLEIALAKGKKLYDKRDDMVKKTQTRDIQRQMKR